MSPGKQTEAGLPPVARTERGQGRKYAFQRDGGDGKLNGKATSVAATNTITTGGRTALNTKRRTGGDEAVDTGVEGSGGSADGGAGPQTNRGLRMTWFAGSRMTAETAAVGRLLRTGAEDCSSSWRCSRGAAAEETRGESGAAGSNQMSAGMPSGCDSETAKDSLVGNDAVPVQHPDSTEARNGEAVTEGIITRAYGGRGGTRDPTADETPDSAASSTTTRTSRSGSNSRSSETGDEVSEGNQQQLPATHTAGATRTRALASSGDDQQQFPPTSSAAAISTKKSTGVQPPPGGSDVVLLFCRLPNEPYVFCGRLGYVDHWPDERPVRFLWRLHDAERLAAFPDFAAVVEAAGVDIG